MSIDENSIKLKKIKEVLNEKFFIPCYQRGYRWTANLVVDLLDDLEDFFSKNEGIYCLQPLVVKRIEKYAEEDLVREIKKQSTVDNIKLLIQNNVLSYEVIDGQQRLTTLYILLKVLGANCNPFEIYYETRPKSKEYLSALNNSGETEAQDNIDYYFIYEAKKTITKWLNEKKPDKYEFYENILNRVQFIWYEITKENPVEVFKRLNLGKISLTNSELIKALFLNNSSFADSDHKDLIQLRQREIARDWDDIEQTLQNDEFWYFLNGHDSEKSETRIDFIFDLVVDDSTDSKKDRLDQYKTFRHFYTKFQNNKKNSDNLETEWRTIKECFLMLCEWYNNSELYHYVGFWLDDTPQKSIKKLKQLKENWKRSDTNKKKFVEELKRDIYGLLSNILEKESNRNPNESFDKKVFRPILLFHNIQTIINQNELHANEQIEYSFNLINRFPFYLYKLENWDIEHINSLTDNKMEKLKTQQDWLKNVQWFINDKTVKNEIEDFLKLDDSKIQDKQGLMKRFEKLRSECSLKTDNHWEENEKNSLKNYVLLDASTNRMYKNEIFPVKQKNCYGC